MTFSRFIPARLDMNGSTTFRTAATATTASKVLPPCRKMSAAALDASGCALATTPFID